MLYKVAHRLSLAVISIIAIIPFGVLLYLAFTLQTINTDNKITFSNFVEVVSKFDILNAFKNSIIITLIAIAVLIIFSSLAGYAIARFKIMLNKTIYIIFLFSMMIPAIINTVPLYRLMNAINGVNSHWAVALLLAANALPFATFLYAGFMSTIPIELEEAAKVDGASKLQVFFRIVFPLLKPVTTSIIIINGIGIWNNYAQVVFFLQNAKMHTIPLSISMFYQQFGAQWHLMAAATLLAMIPAVVVFIFSQKYFMEGLSVGGIKG